MSNNFSHQFSPSSSLKTGLLKWRPEYDIAADEYNKAGEWVFVAGFPIQNFFFLKLLIFPPAVCFRNARSFDQCRNCLMKSADCHKMAKSWFHAAKCLDQAILICKDMNSFQDISGLAKKACELYQQHGSPEAGASSLDKAAKILEANHPEMALPLYQQAVDVVMVGGE
jgi:gamma-soluble NSF attachment protein